MSHTPFLDWARRSLRPYGNGKSTPVVTLTLIVACAFFYVAGRFSNGIISRMIFVPALAESDPYRFLSSAFLHGGFWHLVFNMYALWILGSILEPVMGRMRFACLYVLSALAGNVAVLILADPTKISWATGVVGASGAVFGLLGAQLVIARLTGSDLTNLLIVIGLNLAISFSPGSNISWQSHIGGFIMGVLVVALLNHTRTLTPSRRRILDSATMFGFLGLLAVLAFTVGSM